MPCMLLSTCITKSHCCTILSQLFLCSVDVDYQVDSSQLQQSFSTPGTASVCIVLMAIVDSFVENDEALTVRVESTDTAVIADDEDTSIQVTIVDVSPGRW